MERIEAGLQKKINMLNLRVVDDIVYTEYLKVYEEVGIDVTSFQYYGVHGQYLAFYSKEYLMRLPRKEVLKKAKDISQRQNASFFSVLKKKTDVWILKNLYGVLK
ncbi:MULTISPECIES: hypothetical protein [Bacillus]|uniref:hypothetical protein n=1 Tax=Bacillus TaxID=1386 RepID=UPI000BFC7177|nr:MULTISPECIES: hypothetical protein [Bacillus cereus group]EKS8367110.1 hypothetical protein [Bacillus cereus]PGL11661.1 hypothetical protein CN916_32370 [Bacillus thuringiensis]UOB98851.1 hypothetical protein BTI679_62520 [Bacillus wiedmannii]